MVHTYVGNRPDPAAYDFLREDFTALEKRHGGVVGTSFRTYPSFPQRYIEPVAVQTPCEADNEGVSVEPLRTVRMPTRYTEQDLDIRQFTKQT